MDPTSYQAQKKKSDGAERSSEYPSLSSDDVVPPPSPSYTAATAPGGGTTTIPAEIQLALCETCLVNLERRQFQKHNFLATVIPSAGSMKIRYVDPNDPTRIFLQQPTPES